jgi:transcriptional regulator with XRE-family HTH domain
MTHLDESSAGVVALLLDDIAPPRLGTLLRGARKARGFSRRDVAHRVDIKASDLRKYERGDEPVPPHLVAALAECYGPALTEQLATRTSISVDERHLIVGGAVGKFEDSNDDAMLAKYVELVARVRHARPGEPIALRADDVVALSTAIGQETEQVEARIIELLGCTPYEAKSLHAEMLRRKLVVPVAGLVAGLAIIGGVGVASTSNPAPAPAPAHHSAPATQAVDQAAPASHDVAASPETRQAPTTTQPAPPTTVAPPAPAVEEPATEPAAEPAAEPNAHPVTPDTTPMGIPPHETVTIIQP